MSFDYRLKQVIMGNTGDIWLLRKPPISEAEWLSFLETRSDFSVLESPVGRSTDGKTDVLGSLYLWEGGSDGAVVFALSENGIHISPGDEVAWAFASMLAELFGATATEG